MAYLYSVSTLDQGATWSEPITVVGKDFTDCTGICQIRKQASADSPVVASPVVSFPTPLDGVLQLDLTAQQTAMIPLSSKVQGTPDVYYYDVFVTNLAGVVTKEVYGTVSIMPSVTRA